MNKKKVLQLRDKFRICKSQNPKTREMYKKMYIQLDDMLRPTKEERIEEYLAFQEEQYIKKCMIISKLNRKQLKEETDGLGGLL